MKRGLLLRVAIGLAVAWVTTAGMESDANACFKRIFSRFHRDKSACCETTRSACDRGCDEAASESAAPAESEPAAPADAPEAPAT